MNFLISRTENEDGPLREFGPGDKGRLQIPSYLERHVDYPELGLSATIGLEFSGERLEIRRLCVEGSGNGENRFVATKSLTLLALPAVIGQIAKDLVPESRRWEVPPGDQNFKMQIDPMELAQLYWFEHISWGRPRATVMALTGWSRTNTNFHFNKLEQQFGFHLPREKAKSAQTKTSQSQIHAENRKQSVK